MSATTPKFRVAISGAGPAGLTLAVAIGRYSDNIAIDLYEAQPAISTIGAGIGLWERTRNIVQHLGLDEEILAAATPPPPKDAPLFSFRRADQPTEGYPFFRVIPPHSARTLHRTDLIETLKRHLPSTCTVHLGKRLTTYKASATGVTLHFADGSTATADVLIGADGIRSATRQTLFEQILQTQQKLYEVSGSKGLAPEFCKQAIPKWSGTVAYRALFNSEALDKVWPDHRAKAGFPVCYCGKSKHVIAYAVSQGKVINFITFVSRPELEGTTYPSSWVEQVTPEEVAEQTKDWEPEIQALVKCIEKPTKWAIHVIEDLPVAAMGNVAIIGDAAHAMTTNTGSGAGQAIEDAYVLGRLLAHPSTTLERIPEVLKKYESVRLPAANSVVHRSRLAGLLYEFNGKDLYDGSDLPKEQLDRSYNELTEAILDQWKWQWTTNTMDQEWANIESTLPKV